MREIRGCLRAGEQRSTVAGVTLALGAPVRALSPSRLFGLEGLSGATQRGLAIAFSTSIATVMGSQLVYPVLPPMMGQLAVDKSAIGLVVSVYVLPSIFLAPLAGAFADLKGRRPLLFGGLLLFGLGGGAVGFAPSFGWVLALRAVQGIGAAALTPLTILLLSDLVAEERESGAQGAKVVLDRVATSIFPIVAGVLAVISWRLPFALYVLAVPVAVAALAWMPETRHGDAVGLRVYLGGFSAVGRRPRLFVAFAAGFLRFFLDYGYFTYLPIYLSLTRGTSPQVVGLLMASFAVGAMITASQAARLVRRFDAVNLVVGGFLLSGLSVLFIPLLPSEPLVATSLLLYGIGNGLISPMQKSLLTRNAPDEVRAGVISLDRVLQQVAKSLAPGVMGALLLVADVGSVFWVLGTLSVGSVLLAAVLTTRWGTGAALSPAGPRR